MKTGRVTSNVEWDTIAVNGRIVPPPPPPPPSALINVK